IAISGYAVTADQYDRHELHELDQVSLARPITKWARMVITGEDLANSMVKAYRLARSGRPGPVHLTIPLQVQESPVTDELARRLLVRHAAPEPPQPAKQAVARAVDLLWNAQRPLIIAGSGVARGKAWDQLRAFAEVSGIPVFTGALAAGSLSDDHPLCFGYTMPVNTVAEEAFHLADAVLIAGRKVDWELGSGGIFPPDAKLVQIDIDANEIGENRAIDVGIVADAKCALEALTSEAQRRHGWGREPWVRRLGELRSARISATRRATETVMTPSHPGAVWERVSQVIPERATVVVDGGIVTMHIRPALKMRLPLRGTWEAAGSGAIGAGIPFALAAKLARPEEPAFVLTGDGSVGYGIMELDTALRHNLPVIVIVANDSAWGSEKYMIEDTFGRTIGCELRPETRYDRIAQAMGAHGEFVEHLEDVRPAVERALASGLPALVNIAVSTVPGLLQQRVVAERKSSVA
ncbi:MAG: thiamine pyrophosphate-binding protein, partial [Dehalococcoidia bacterium]|nr:thiamine pyrophosphate-binding protein [Dehalococcoidia bacterium]